MGGEGGVGGVTQYFIVLNFVPFLFNNLEEKDVS